MGKQEIVEIKIEELVAKAKEFMVQLAAGADLCG
jgi:hypothetical protein